MTQEIDMPNEPPQLDGTDKSVATAVAPAKKPAPPKRKRKPKKLPPFKVLLHNDDVNTFDHVISSILNVTTIPTREAILRTIEAHESGVALLLVTHLERAELYVEQFATFDIITTIEPADGTG